MPVPLAPYPTPPAPHTPPSANGQQSQLVCSGCRNLLLYPVGASSVCCAVCNAVTAVPPPGTEMAQLICGGCHTLLMYIRGATSVQCSCCHTVNLAMEGINKHHRAEVQQLNQTIYRAKLNDTETLLSWFC
ncbi:protein LOL1 isoform X3 [Arachis ipaensis]|uniref:protein LOL1 isoform X3 n=1 Tax=Arachis ipaensis TaxID=130454 RepID=UPI0007AF957B|nr:protein LOL1 isoform X3 [Arachis ipaensis]XP_025627318.1 protein LOL1 isoform X3 [Arachis hypogaea]XP_025699461.1 protein LOL1 isoform X3 [Arachis hypogaea]